MATQTKAALETDRLDVVADRGYFDGEEILACHEAGITVTLPKPLTSNSKAKGRYGKQFSWWWKGGTISLNLDVIWGMSGETWTGALNRA